MRTLIRLRSVVNRPQTGPISGQSAGGRRTTLEECSATVSAILERIYAAPGIGQEGPPPLGSARRGHERDRAMVQPA